MNKRILILVVLSLAAAVCLGLIVNYSQSLRLFNVDKVELLKLEKVGDSWKGNIEASKTLEGDEAKKFVSLWAAQSYDYLDSAICHTPSYGIKLYAKGELVTNATICWDCNNIEFLKPKWENTWGFDGTGAEGQELLQVFKEAFPEK